MALAFRLSYLAVLCVLLHNWNLVLAEPLRLSPQPKQVDLTGSPVTIRGGQLSIDDAARTQFRAAVMAVEQRIGPPGGGLPIHVQVLANADATSLPPDIREILGRREAYWLEVKKDAIRVVGADAMGALRGLTTLEHLILAGQGSIPQGHIVDWPDHKVRGLHVVLGSANPNGPSMPTSVVRRLIDQCRQMHYNLLMIELSNSVQFRSMTRIVRRKSWTLDEFLDVVRYARENGLEVIPDLHLLTHQEKLLAHAYPELMYNKTTYDPRKEEVYALVLPMLDEVIDLLRPRAVGIGHDEVAGYIPPKRRSRHIAFGETMLPPALFLQDVQRLHAHLQKRGVETWMWGDMLLAPEEFPTMLDRHLKGTHGYAALRNKMPKEIVISDWHYYDTQSDFPSALAFAQAGHRVLGVTYTSEETIRNFSRYVARLPAGAEGMLQTLWHQVRDGKAELVDRMIKTAGESFWNAR